MAKRVMVVDDDARTLRLLAAVLAAPEFEVHTFQDPRVALKRLPELAPHLIVADVLMPGMDGRLFFWAVKRLPELRAVPFIFLSGLQAGAEIVEALEGGADDFIDKPFHLERLVAKVRATLRMAERLTAAERPAEAVTGEVGERGTLPLLKFCEDNRLTGRLTVRAAERTLWVDFFGGEIVEAGGEPPLAGEEPLDALLAIAAGTYQIDQRPLDPAVLYEPPATAEPEPVADEAAPAAERAVSIPMGRLSKLDVRGQAIEVQTEAENRPNFTVTTVVAASGRVLRKSATGWQHPLQKSDDLAFARSWIDRQHDRVLRTLKSLEAPVAPAAEAPAATGDVDGSLLAWALSFGAEPMRSELGSVTTVALLRRTRKAALADWGVLRAFEVTEDGRIACSRTGRSLPREAVKAVAAWTASFLKAAAAREQDADALPVRQATGMMQAELDALGYYAAVDEALGRRAG